MTGQHTNRLKEAAAFCCFLAALLGFVWLASALLIPHREVYGANWGGYAKEKRGSLDAIFFGSSIVYCDVVPAVIYDRAGIASYVLAGPEQTLTATEYYVKEAFRTQSPRLAAVEVNGAFYSEYTAYTKANIGYMPPSLNRLLATFRAAEPEERLGLLFPLVNYHDEWPHFQNLRYDADNLAGYTPMAEANQIGGIYERPVEAFSQAVFDRNIESLREIVRFCKSRDCKVLFFLAPNHQPWEGSYRAMLEEELKTIEGADFIDFNRRFDEEELSGYRDFYDPQHLNTRGAETFSAYLAGIVKSYVDTPREPDKTLWEERVNAFKTVRAE
ncbi:MAG: hypothetical protein LBR72_05990 [Oscillospiraceae bacterium]|nr:hypothetical protein [Oscillospiraceae bacterium]